MFDKKSKKVKSSKNTYDRVHIFKMLQALKMNPFMGIS